MNSIVDNANIIQKNHLLEDINRCVACGLCLKNCPTYEVNHKEGQSPRGRILLAKGIIDKRLEIDQTISTNIEQCLHCGNCESVCPTNVPYAKIIDATKAILRKQGALSKFPVWLKYIIEKSFVRYSLGELIGFWQNSGIQKIARKYKLLGKDKLSAWESMLPPKLEKKSTHNMTACDNEVFLFTGCVAPLVERPTFDATTYLLNACGFRVKRSSQQTCCGAIYQHSGNPALAQKHMDRNLKVLHGKTVISCASGCGMQWESSKHNRHFDINDFLVQFSNMEFKKLNKTVALHSPCSAKNASKQSKAPLELLMQIPELKVKLLSDDYNCCGAGGTHLLERSQTGKDLASKIISFLIEHNIRTLLTTNTGCAMHLRRNIYERQMDIEVIHPVVLLYRQHKAIEIRG